MDAATFLATCTARRITIERIQGSIITLSQKFQAGDNNAYASAETDVSIIYEAPGKGGSVWGTDGGSIGGMVAMNTGLHRMNKSGVQKRWLAQLAQCMRTAPAGAPA